MSKSSAPLRATSKFALRDYSGNPKIRYLVETVSLGGSEAPARAPSDHILVVDRSGSMYGDIEALRSYVEKIVTLREFEDPNSRFSLISFSSQGDVKLHFAHVTVTDVMRAGSPYLQEIRAIRATSMTCISQGLKLAETLIDDTRVTAISLHTDGYANDRSPSAEGREIQSAVDALKKHPRVFVNTIAYRDSCDFALMARIANQLSGTCVQARDLRQVYQALYDTSKLLAGSVAPTVEVPGGGASYVLFVSRSARKVLGSATSLQVQGLASTDDRIAYRLTEVDAAAYDAATVPVNGESAPAEPIFALSRALLAEGQYNQAKYALVAARHEELLTTHARALVVSDIARMAAAVEEQLFHGTPYTYQRAYGLPAAGPSVLRVMEILNRHPEAEVEVDLKALTATYRRRGVKRIPGTRTASGEIEPPVVEGRPVKSVDGFSKTGGFELNRNTATANLLVRGEQEIYRTASGERITDVAGVKIDRLATFNNYTIVSDGQLNVAALTLRTAKGKALFNELKSAGAITGTYTPNAPFTVRLDTLPLVDYGTAFATITPEDVRHLAELTVLGKFLSGMLKGESTDYTPEQVAALKAVGLSPKLYLTTPTTTPYSDLQKALSDGSIDTRLSYKIDVGLPALTSLAKLKSGNDFLDRRFVDENAAPKEKAPKEKAPKGEKAPKAPKLTLDRAFNADVKLAVKPTGRLKLDANDEIAFPVYAGLLGLGDEKLVRDLLENLGLDVSVFIQALRGSDKDVRVTAAADALGLVEKAVEAVYEKIRPLAFYVGATGIVPEELQAKAFNAEQFEIAYPDAALSSSEKDEGTFFVLPSGVVLTVYVKGEYYSTGAEVPAVAAA
jgi:Mg-chelatase subunit ChlD